MLNLTLTSLQRMLFIVSLVLLSAGTGMAATLTDLNDSGAGSLRAAIAAAAPGDTINFSVTGTIMLASELAIDKNLTIQGPGANLLTISGNNAVRVFNIGSLSPGINVTLTGLTIASGIGGGIYNNSTLTITNSTLAGNSANNSGGDSQRQHGHGDCHQQHARRQLGEQQRRRHSQQHRHLECH